MDASCGPTNAVSQLAKHSQRDQSLQRERFGGHVDAPAFRSHGAIDGQLNREFHQFNESGASFEGQFGQPQHQNQFSHQFQKQQNQNQFQNEFQNQQNQNQFSHQFQNQQNQHQNQNQHQFHNQGKERWVQDFSSMSLQQNAQKSDWQQRFMQMQNQGQSGPMARPMASIHGLPGMAQVHGSQADAVHLDEKSLAAQFDEIEQEMAENEATAQMQSVTAEDVPQEVHEARHSDNEQFAEAARQVHESMSKGQASEETSAKFQQSNFLKLMTSISDRQVELSQEGDKLVTKSGEDIRQYMSDPLRHEKAEPTYHQPMHEAVEDYPPLHGDQDILRHRQMPESLRQSRNETRESESVRSHLPDPLAHIKDGQLSGDLSSLQAAQVISGGQVQAQSWMEDGMWDTPKKGSILSPADQELFDDYRNDDDF